MSKRYVEKLAKESKMIRYTSRSTKILGIVASKIVSLTGAWNFATCCEHMKVRLCQRAKPWGTKTRRMSKKIGGPRGRGCCEEAACHKKSPAAHKLTLDLIWRMPNGSRPLCRFRAYFFGVTLESTYAGCSPLLSDSMLIKSRTQGNEMLS